MLSTKLTLELDTDIIAMAKEYATDILLICLKIQARLWSSAKGEARTEGTEGGL